MEQIYILLDKSKRKNKKFVMNFIVIRNGKQIVFYKTHFGDNRYEDYSIHKDDKRKERYLKRHTRNEKWDDFVSAGSLSRFILWNKKTIKDSLKDYAKRFDLIILNEE